MDRRSENPQRRRYLLAVLPASLLAVACGQDPQSRVNQMINTGTAADTFTGVSSRMRGATASEVFLRAPEVYGRPSAPWRLLDTSVTAGPNPYERSEAYVTVLSSERHDSAEGLWRGYMVLPDQTNYSVLINSIKASRADELLGKTLLAEEDRDKRVFRARVQAFRRDIDARKLLSEAGYALALEMVDPNNNYEPIRGSARVFALSPKQRLNPSTV